MAVIKVGMLEKDGVEFDTPVEVDLAEAVASVGLKYYHTSLTADVTISTTVATSDGLSFTPEAGTYLCWYGSETSHATSGIDNRGEISVQVAGVNVTNSVREFGITLAGISLASAGVRANPNVVCVVTVNGTQIVRSTVRQITGSTITVGSRSLTLLKIGA